MSNTESEVTAPPPVPKKKYLPKDPEYFKKYYHAKVKSKVECPICLSIVGQNKIKRHQETKICKRLANVFSDTWHLT